MHSWADIHDFVICREYFNWTRTRNLNSLTNLSKSVESIRVDGASYEGPSHKEVQFFWTVQHIKTPSVTTLVSALNGGESYLKRVEL